MDNDRMQSVAEDYRSGMSFAKLIKKYGHCHQTIRNILDQCNVPIRKNVGRTAAHTAEIIRLYKSDMDSVQIGKKFGIAPLNIRKCLKKNGIERRKRKEYCKNYPIDISLFRDPSNEITSYWLGFLMADGHMRYDPRTKSHIVRCKLSWKDVDHLYKFANDLKTPKQPKKGPSKSPRGRILSSATFWVTNKELYELFESYGWFQFKNGIMALPRNINKRHWMRGLIDGDGTVATRRSYTQLIIGFCSPHKSIVDWVRRFLCGRIGRENLPKIYERIPELGTQKMYMATCFGSSAVKIARYLYTSQTRCLQRKFDKVAPFLFG